MRSLNYHRTGQAQVLKSRKDHIGYLNVVLCKDGQMKYFKVHRLVAQAFVPNPLNFPEVNHRNEDKGDNRATNLEWCDHRYNQNYGTRNERIAKANLNHPAISKPVLQYDLSGNLVQEWPSAMEVYRQTGWDRGYISNCCLGKLKTAYHHVWRFVDDVLPITVETTLF